MSEWTLQMLTKNGKGEVKAYAVLAPLVSAERARYKAREIRRGKGASVCFRIISPGGQLYQYTRPHDAPRDRWYWPSGEKDGKGV